MVHSEAFQYTHVNQPQLFVDFFDCYFGRVSMYNVVPFQLLDISEPRLMSMNSNFRHYTVYVMTLSTSLKPAKFEVKRTVNTNIKQFS
jgi:hypothetical protein